MIVADHKNLRPASETHGDTQRFGPGFWALVSHALSLGVRQSVKRAPLIFMRAGSNKAASVEGPYRAGSAREKRSTLRASQRQERTARENA